LALSVPDSSGVFFVPALAGLAAPYWDSHARGTIIGLTRGTTRAHIVRAALEGVAFRTRDVLEAMAQDTGHPIRSIKADGGASANAFLMQTLADLSGVEVRVAAMRETTALGAGFMAGLGAGLWSGTRAIEAIPQNTVVYTPQRIDNRDEMYRRWQEAVKRARGWDSLSQF
ncbi:MAG: glycerol kinase, partial [Chloroflexi bacterium]|nr:glycerol kinase [Chloroflexota bacterium]